MATLPARYAEGWAEENAIYRTARKRYRCNGSGIAQSPGCSGVIEPGDPYIEYVGETPAFQRGSAHCIPCAVAFEFICPECFDTEARRLGLLVRWCANAYEATPPAAEETR